MGVTLWMFVGLLGKPRYVTLYSGLKPGDAQALGSRLAAKNIAYELSPDGSSLLVPAEQLDASRLETASQGLPRNARLGFELFDTPNWAGSDFTEKVNYQRALEGELERTLQTLSEVEAVRVHLVLAPGVAVHANRNSRAKAAVILKTRGGACPSRRNSRFRNWWPARSTACARRMSRWSTPTATLRCCVPGAEVAGPRPTIWTRSWRRPWCGRSSTGGRRRSRARQRACGVRPEHQRKYRGDLRSQSHRRPDPAEIGREHGRSRAGGSSRHGQQSSGRHSSGGRRGRQRRAQPDTQSSRSESTTFAVSKSVRHTVQPPGRIKRIAAAVLVDDAVETVEKDGKKSSTRRKRTAEEMKQIEPTGRGGDRTRHAARRPAVAARIFRSRSITPETPAAPTRLDAAFAPFWRDGPAYCAISGLRPCS